MRATLAFAYSSALVAMTLGCSDDNPSGAGGASATGSITSSSSSTVISAVSVGTTGSGASLPDLFTVTGVVTDGASPLEGATVLQGGGKPAFVTGPDGAFSIELSTNIPGTPTVVAAKEGYRSAGIEFQDLPTAPVELALHEAAPPDNALGYVYGPPGVGDAEKDDSTAVCGHCHTTLVAQFLTSAHAKSAKDPLVQDLYAGTSRAFTDAASCAAAGGEWRKGRVPGSLMDSAERCYLGNGVLPDLNGCGAKGAMSCDDPALPEMEKPHSFGACADCHAIGLHGAQGGRDLLDATGIAFEDGNHCDACHKVRDIDLSKPPGTAGRLLLQRPRETITDEPGAKLRQVMFGPLLDVPNEFMGGSYQPKFAEATFCAGCHEQTQDALLPGATVDPARFPSGLPTHSTFSEWSESAWAEAGAPCQHCHMPPNDGLFNTMDVTTPDNAGIVFGFPRPAEQIRSHAFRGPLSGSPRLLDTALGAWMTAKITNTSLSVTVTLSNQGAGHALPTGEPMRALLLVVKAEACGKTLLATSGPTLSDVGGVWAEAIVGQTVSVAGTAFTWADGATRAAPGMALRVVRETGGWLEYPGIGYFANPALTAQEKGIPIRAAVGEAKIVSISGDVLETDTPLAVMPGDLVFLGDPLPGSFADGSPSLALAGWPGRAFARVLVDPPGKRRVPHYRAVDMASDDRLPPLVKVSTSHVFEMPAGCKIAEVTAAAIYRPVPVEWAKERGWEARDWIVETRKEIVTTP